MAALAHQIGGLRCPSLASTQLSRKSWKNNSSSCVKPYVVRAAVTTPGVGVPTAETRERARLKEMFEDAYERCRTNPMEGVAFKIDDFYTAIQDYDFNSEIGTKDMLRRKATKPYSPNVDAANAEAMPKDNFYAMSPQQMPSPVSLSSTFGSGGN